MDKEDIKRSNDDNTNNIDDNNGDFEWPTFSVEPTTVYIIPAGYRLD